MFIDLHILQNHSPSNLNRDDLGAPKTCWFGGTIRARISSQCLKRSIRTSEQFADYMEAIRTRRLLHKILEGVDDLAQRKRALAAMQDCGLQDSLNKQEQAEFVANGSLPDGKLLVFIAESAIGEMRDSLQNISDADELAECYRDIIANGTMASDIALFGRMLEPSGDMWKNTPTGVEAAAQVAHAISTHTAQPEIDYFTAKDDVEGTDEGAGHIAESLFNSACYYKYASVHPQGLLKNLGGDLERAHKALLAFIHGAALANPSGKQNSFAAHNPPDLIVVEVRNAPLSYANAFARPISVDKDGKDEDGSLVRKSVRSLRDYIRDMDAGYGDPAHRWWFSPNMRHGRGSGKSEIKADEASSLKQLLDHVRGYLSSNEA